MKFFDLHCDTLTAIYKSKAALYKNRLAVSAELVKKADFEKSAAVFAVFIPDKLKGASALKYFQNVLSYAYSRGGLSAYGADNHESAAFARVNSINEIYTVSEYNAPPCCLLSVENGNILAGDISNIRLLSENAVRMLTLTWNGENELGSGSRRNLSRLTGFGKKALKELENRNIIIDVSHLNDKGFADVAALTEKPFAASHSNARKICDHPRNLTDLQLKAIFNRGGLVGINFYPRFCGKGDIFERIYEHISHMLYLGGEKSLCIGSDFDGAKMRKSLNKVDSVPALYYYLNQRGLDKNTLDLIFFENAFNFFGRI